MDQEIGQKKHWLGETHKDRRNNVIVILLSVVLVVVVVLFVMQRMDHQVIINEINTEKDSIQFELSEIIASYDSLQTDNDTLNQQLFFAQTKVKDLLVEVEQTKKVSFQRINKYQKEITSLRGIMRNYIVQVDSLNRRNKELMAENREVKEQFRQAENKNQQLGKENTRLQQNLQRAAMLEARELIAEPINSRSKATKYAKRAQKVRISLTLSKNVTTKRGAKNVYVRIMRPDQLLMVKNQGDVFKFEDLEIQYSAVRNVNYEGNELPVNIYWDNTSEPQMMVGEYTVDIFADESNIGTTTFNLK